MHSRYITIDGGTTNTRISYVLDNEILETIKIELGSNPREYEKMKLSCKETISYLTSKYGEIECIIGCGMITSEYGIYNVNHLASPSGIEDFHNNMVKLHLSDISSYPIYLIPGIKCAGDDFLKVNMMRGEETELFGLINNLDSDSVYILPGSHSKIIYANENGKIVSIRSFMTGEMFSALSRYTILSNSIDADEEINEEYLKFGYDFTQSNGLNEALLKVRTMDILFHKTKSELYSFFIGCILHDEIKEIIKTKESRVYIGGQKKLKYITKLLLSFYSNKEVISIPDEICEKASIFGMIKIYEYKK